MSFKTSIYLVILTQIFTITTYAQNTNIQDLCSRLQVRETPYNSTTTDRNATAVMSLAHANAYFNEIKKTEYNIPYQYVVDGCDMRAFLISKNLKEKFGIDTFRVALEPTRGSLIADTRNTLEGFVEFSSHTASAFCVLNPSTQRVEPYVLDPSFFNAPQPYSTWVRTFTESSYGQVPYRAYTTTMYSLDPRTRRTSFNSNDVREAERLRTLFMRAQTNMLETGRKPVGVGRAREVLRFDSTGVN